MQGITIVPGVPGSALLENVPEPPLSRGTVLVRTIAPGICGINREPICGHRAVRLPAQPLVLQ